MQELNSFYRGVLATTDHAPVIAAADVAAAPALEVVGRRGSAAALAARSKGIQLRAEDARPAALIGDEESAQAGQGHESRHVDRIRHANGTQEAPAVVDQPDQSKYLSSTARV